VADGVAFFTAGIPTIAAGEAVMVLLAWLVIVVAVCATVTSALRNVRSTEGSRRPYPTASLLLAVGLILSAVGVVQHALPASSMCCGAGTANIREAISLAR
jgi:uncharacterized membrane protein YoaK (UPF0700 family)